MRIGFDNAKYLELQREKIMERVNEFGGKLYIEFGGKLFDDYHASRVLPGFQPDAKVKMLTSMKDDVEIVIVISAVDIAHNKLRQDIGITYEQDVLRGYDELTRIGLYVGSVVFSQFDESNVAAVNFQRKLEANGIKVYRTYNIDGYPTKVSHIVSAEGFGKNDYIKTSRNVVVVTAPGPGSGKMATCLSQIYHDAQHGIKSGYAKYETFPVWNLPLTHPVNIAYESATADLDDINMIDPWHLNAYGEYAVNYNRDVDVFPVLNAIFTRVLGTSPYKSPTDMGVNMVGYCISDDQICQQAAKQEVIRRYMNARVECRKGNCSEQLVEKLKLMMTKLDLKAKNRPVIEKARAHGQDKDGPVACIELADGTYIFGKTSPLMSCGSAVILNALKHLANLPDVPLIAGSALAPIQKLKRDSFGERSAELHIEEALIALSASTFVNPMASLALEQIVKLKGCQLHTTAIPPQADTKIYRKLGISATSDPIYATNQVYFD